MTVTDIRTQIFDQGNKRFGVVQRKEKEQNVSVPSASS